MQSLNTKYDNPIKILATGIGKEIRRLLTKKQAFNWIMSFSTHGFQDVVELDNVVYLTDSATEVFTHLDPKLIKKYQLCACWKC